MRRQSWVRNALCLLIFATPALLIAQFQKPTDDELKMTADPKAPGAAAVYLYREETTDDTSSFDRIQSFYERIKVLTEKGKELATISIPYQPEHSKITDIQGRTIHPDGTVIPFAEKPTDIENLKTKGFQTNSVVFTLPSVEVGSILEYRYHYRDWLKLAPTWWIQQPYFVHKAHYSYIPGSDSSQMFATYINSDARVACCKNNTYTLDIADVPPAPDEDWMPPLNTLRWRVEFFNTQVKSGKDFWDSAGKDWATTVQDFTNPTGVLKKAVAEIVAPSDTDQQKAEKIYAAVMKLDNTRFTRTKSEAERKKEKLKDIKKAEDVWKQKSGSDDDIDLLFVALARTAGLKVWPMMVVDRSRAIFDANYLSVGQLDDYIALIELAGKEVFLDPGQQMCPFGSLHWKHTLTSGFRLSDKGAVMDRTPAINYMESAAKQIAEVSFDEDGSVKGTARIVLTGPEALYWRQLALENDEEEVKKRFIESMSNSLPEGVQAELDQLIALNDYSASLIGIFRVSGNIGAATGKHFLLPGLFFESRAKHPFVAQSMRITPIDLHYPRMEQDDVIYHLPKGYIVESAPQTSDVDWPNRALLQIHSTPKEGSVEVARTFARNFALLDPKVYNDLHDFYLKLAAADQQQVVLTRAAEAKGK